jgi:energy-coupling factor transporter ATP-binding protein EcfA2
MKVRSIHIPDLFHFKDFYLDLTYPKGHAKAGQPLDKVCIIGQSGTGKTTLLKLISVLSYTGGNYKAVGSMEKLSEIALKFDFDNFTVEKHIEEEEDGSIMYGWDSQTQEGKKVSYEEATKRWDDVWEPMLPKSLYFPAELEYNLEVDSADTHNLMKKKFIDFSIDKAANTWKVILADIQKYQEDEIKMWQEISTVAESSKDIKAIQKAVEKIEKWRETAPNPIVGIANNCLDPLLKHFGLRVKTKLDFQGKEDIGFIKIEDFHGNEVPNGLLSTGTKQAMLSALPLYLLKPDRCQILYDEPERSLYPDIQRMIIDYYIKLTTNSQFFFATHSPIIAASFEPWEIVELKFDEKWNVYRDKYYEGVNHVDNYYIDPRYLDYDLILKKVFDLKDTNTDLRTAAIVEITMLKNQIDTLKSTGKLKTKEAKEILTRYKILAKKLAWKTE